MPISPYVAGLRRHVGTDLLMLPGACGVVIDDDARVLLIQRSDTARWELPAGASDPGEQPADTCVREVFEETGVRVEVTRLAGISLDDVVYPHGDHCQYMVPWFRCRPLTGTAAVNDDEALAVAWFPLDALPELDAVHRHRIETALTEDAPAWFTPAARI